MRASIALGGVALCAILVLTGVWDGPPRAVVPSGAPVAAAHVEWAGSSAAESGPSSAPEPLTVLLMGDSYTAGNGARAGGEAAYYGPERCMRSTNTWGEQYARLLVGQGFAVTLMNRACSAATADEVLHGKSMKDSRVVVYPDAEDAKAPLSDEFYTTWAASSPRCTPKPATEEYFTPSVLRSQGDDGSVTVAVSCKRWIAPQVDALNPDVDLVLLTLGGNDAHFPDIVRSCLIMGDAGLCEGAIDAALTYVDTDYADDLVDVFTEIVRRTDGHARVAYLAYPGLETNDELRLTSVGASGVHSFPVAEQLSRLAAEGMRAQRDAVDRVNAAAGADTITFVDEIPALFDGHEPDARPGVANDNRWIYEVFETTTRDEWYHLKPQGHSRIAQLMVSRGVFGARDDNGRARDVALVLTDDPGERVAAEDALGEQDLWFGARVSLVQERWDEQGGLERRVIATDVEPADAAAALRGANRAAWHKADDVRIPSRWNASAQTIYVGPPVAPEAPAVALWQSAENEEDLDIVRSTAVFHTDGDIAQASLEDRLVAAVERAARAPHAWAGGPYVEGGRDLVLSAGGSVGDAPLDFSWDLDGNGDYETRAKGPLLSVPWGTVTSGWVAVRVTTAGAGASVALAWVSAHSEGAAQALTCRADAGVRAGPSASAGQACGAQPMSGAESELSQAPVSPTPAHGKPQQASAAVRERALAALSLFPVYAEPRLTTFTGARSEIPTRAGDRSRARPSELVLRERGLRALVSEGSATPSPG